MANTGLTWSSYSAVQKSAGDWTSDDILDTATETGDSTSIDGKAAAVVSVTAVEDGTGAVDDTGVIVHILGDIDGTNFEEPNQGNAYAVKFLAVQSDTIRVLIPVDVRLYKNFKVAVENQCGQTVAITVKIQTATIALAS